MTDTNDNLALAFALWGMNDEADWDRPTRGRGPRKPTRRQRRKAAKAQRRAATKALRGPTGQLSEADVVAAARSMPEGTTGGHLVVWLCEGARPEVRWAKDYRSAWRTSWDLGRAKSRQGGTVKIVPMNPTLLEAIQAAQADLATGLI